MPSPMPKPSAAIHHSADFLCTLIETEIAHAVQPYQNALASIKVILAAHCLAITDNQLVFVGIRAKALASLDAVVKGFATDPTTYKPVSPASIVEVLAQCISRMDGREEKFTQVEPRAAYSARDDAQSALRDTTAARSSAPYALKDWEMKASASDTQPTRQQTQAPRNVALISQVEVEGSGLVDTLQVAGCTKLNPESEQTKPWEQPSPAPRHPLPEKPLFSAQPCLRTPASTHATPMTPNAHLGFPTVALRTDVPAALVAINTATVSPSLQFNAKDAPPTSVAKRPVLVSQSNTAPRKASNSRLSSLPAPLKRSAPSPLPSKRGGKVLRTAATWAS
ncbi:hypothetical protein B0H11DRAFT_1911796 [Mycena galericulata]|nr:hypothetical protein B0H11DRAFT_1911796 [Mycena galericulata]